MTARTKLDPDAVRKLVHSGLSLKAIAVRLGVSQQSVCRVMRAHGMRVRFHSDTRTLRALGMLGLDTALYGGLENLREVAADAVRQALEKELADGKLLGLPCTDRDLAPKAAGDNAVEAGGRPVPGVQGVEHQRPVPGVHGVGEAAVPVVPDGA